MTAVDLLAMLDGDRKSRRGWLARCPAHQDRNPSLSVNEGDRGILLKCWSGCTLAEICVALGIKPRELFYDASGPADRDAMRRRQAKREAARVRRWVQGKKIDVLRCADQTIKAATRVDINAWPADKLDEMIDRVCQAHSLVLQETQA